MSRSSSNTISTNCAPASAATCLDLVEELRPAEVLGQHDVVPVGEVPRGHGQRQPPRDQPGRGRVVPPAPQQPPDAVEFEHQGQRVVVGVAAREGVLADRRRTVEQDQPRHGGTLAHRRSVIQPWASSATSCHLRQVSSRDA